MRRIAKFHKVSLEQFMNVMREEFPEYTEEDVRTFYEAIKLPGRATRGSAGYDFYSPFSFSLKPGVREDPYRDQGGDGGGLGAETISPQRSGI